MHPFDIKTALLALFVMGVVFDLVAHRTKNRAVAAAYYNLFAAAISTVPVLVTGVLAWQWALEGEKLKGILLWHLVLACASSVLIWIVTWVHFQVNRRAGLLLPVYRWPIELLTVVLVVLTGHLGGFLSGVNIPS